MLRVQRDYRFSRFQSIADQEPEQVGFALAAVAEDQGAGIGFVVRPPIQIHNYIGAVLIPANIETHRICFTRVTDRVQIGYTGCGKNTLRKRAKRILPRRIGREEAFSLP